MWPCGQSEPPGPHLRDVDKLDTQWVPQASPTLVPMPAAASDHTTKGSTVDNELTQVNQLM